MSDEPLIHTLDNVERIDRVYVFMSIDDQGKNGIVASILSDFGTTPLITASPNVAEKMKPFAQTVARLTGKPVGMFAFRRETQLWQTE